MNRDAYCTGGEGCTHWLPKNFQRVLATKVLPASSLIVKPAIGGKGVGRSSGRGRGRGSDKRNLASEPALEQEADATNKKSAKKRKATDVGDD